MKLKKKLMKKAINHLATTFTNKNTKNISDDFVKLQADAI